MTGIAQQTKVSHLTTSSVSPDSREATVGDVLEYAGEPNSMHRGYLHRNFKARHIQMIALGANIGSGVLISSGKALRYGSAPGMLIGYPLICIMAYTMLNILSEQSCLFPTSGSFIDHAARFVDPSLGFAIGFCEWFGALTVIAAEGAVFPIVVSYWTTSVPTAAWMTIYLVVVFGFHLMPNRWFAEFEFATGTVKVVTMLVLILTMMAICGGAGPDGSVTDAVNYTELKAFPNGFKGIASVFLLASWATGGQEIIGIAAGEAQVPRFDLPRACVNLFARIMIVYVGSCVLISVAVPYTDPLLLRNSGTTAASPFVIAMTHAGIKVLPDIVNVVLLISLCGIGSESFYTASRIQTAMARMGMMPAIFNRVDSVGRPYWSLLSCAVVGIVMTYINCSTGGATAFTWFSSVSATTTFFAWITISITNFRMHRALGAQNDPAWSEKYAFCTRWYPAAPIFLLVATLFTFACTIYVSADPVEDKPGAAVFFQTMLCLPLFFFCLIAYKLYFKTNLVSPEQADLSTGRRHLTEKDLEFLDQYYSQSRWRRFASYFVF